MRQAAPAPGPESSTTKLYRNTGTQVHIVSQVQIRSQVHI
jgi:hypothetical protein